MKKSIIIFVTAMVFAIGILSFGWVFVFSQAYEAVLTEETLSGNRETAEGLTVGFTGETKDRLKWVNCFDYSTNRTKSTIKREPLEDEQEEIKNEFRFTGEDLTPYFTQVEYGRILTALQNQEIKGFYNDIQDRVMKTGETEIGKIKVKDYIDYYPIGFRFQFGKKIYDMDNALTGLKILEERGVLDEETGSGYNREVEMYNILQDAFAIPVIENEYQKYKISKVKNFNPKRELGYQTKVKNSLGKGEDYYRFNPILIFQDEPLKAEKQWEHPDLAGGKTPEEKHKNRIIFIVNNRTEKGRPVDISQIKGGYGIYVLPVDVSKYSSREVSGGVITSPDPQPIPSKLQMVYPLDTEAEYTELSLSKDHRYLAVFSEKGGTCSVDIVDADNWNSSGSVELFAASEKMTYTWGDDGSLAVTDGKESVAIFERTEIKNKPYTLIYRGKTEVSFNDIFFGRGLSVAAKDGKAALVQNPTIDGKLSEIRNASIVCTVIDKKGIRYIGRLKNNLVDWSYDMETKDIESIKKLLYGNASDEEGSKVMQKQMLRPSETENWVKWEN